MAEQAQSIQQIKRLFELQIKEEIARAATTTMKQAGDEFKSKARANIAASGMGSRMQNSFRVNVYPANRIALAPAIFGYHVAGYAELYENGGVIQPRRGTKLWIPLPTVPMKSGRRPSPRKLGIKLTSVNVRGKKPLLVGRVNGTAKPVPLYVGVNSVTVRKRWNIAGVAEAISNRLPVIFDQVLKD